MVRYVGWVGGSKLDPDNFFSVFYHIWGLLELRITEFSSRVKNPNFRSPFWQVTVTGAAPKYRKWRNMTSQAQIFTKISQNVYFVIDFNVWKYEVIFMLKTETINKNVFLGSIWQCIGILTPAFRTPPVISEVGVVETWNLQEMR